MTVRAPPLRTAQVAVTAVLVMLGGWGCPRLILEGTETPAPVLRPAGEACLEARQCASGFCVDGLCCNSACNAYETCALSGLRGTCVARPLGSPCRADTQCSTGHCAPEGVCCNVECGAPCQTCTAPDLEGQCEPASDNTDPQDRCEGACNVCFSGACAPAVVGTNPVVGGEVGFACEPGLACDTAGSCALASGSRCASNGECASGKCIAGLCLSAVLEAVEPPGLRSASFRRVLAAALRGDGAPCVLLEELAYSTAIQTALGPARFKIDDAQVGLACREPTGWRLTPWFSFDPEVVVDGSYSELRNRLAHYTHLVTVPSGVVAVVLSNLRDGSSPPGPDFAALTAPVGKWCRMGAQWFHANGVLGAYRCLLTNEDMDGKIMWASVAGDGAGGMHALVARRETLDLLEVSCPSFQCTGLKVWANDTSPFGNGTLAVHQGRPVSAELQGEDGLSLRIQGETGVLLTWELAASGCAPGASRQLTYDRWVASPFNATTLTSVTNDRLHVTVQCFEGAVLLRMVSSQGPSAGWMVESVTSLPEVVNVEAAVPEGLLLLQRTPLLSFRLPGTPDREQALDTSMLGSDRLEDVDRPLGVKVIPDPLLPMLFLERNDSTTFIVLDELPNGSTVRRYVDRPARSVWMLRTRPDDRVLRPFGN